MNLTSEQEESLKKQRRLLRNRESAAMSRAKRRDLLSTLEARSQDLITRLKKLDSQIDEMKKSNQDLRTKITVAKKAKTSDRKPQRPAAQDARLGQELPPPAADPYLAMRPAALSDEPIPPHGLGAPLAPPQSFYRTPPSSARDPYSAPGASFAGVPLHGSHPRHPHPEMYPPRYARGYGDPMWMGQPSSFAGRPPYPEPGLPRHLPPPPPGYGPPF